MIAFYGQLTPHQSQPLRPIIISLPLRNHLICQTVRFQTPTATRTSPMWLPRRWLCWRMWLAQNGLPLSLWTTKTPDGPPPPRRNRVILGPIKAGRPRVGFSRALLRGEHALDPSGHSDQNNQSSSERKCLWRSGRKPPLASDDSIFHVLVRRRLGKRQAKQPGGTLKTAGKPRLGFAPGEISLSMGV